jgi:hypothetical protein
VPQWRFPGSRQVEMMLSSSERATSAAERALLRLPASGKTREWMTAVHRQQTNLDFLRKYADLYQAYTQAEVIYDDSRTHALHRSLPPELADEHGFDPSVIDWEHYLQEVHSPSVTEMMRGFAKNRAGGRKSAAPALPERTDIAAVFDLEGTIIASNLIESYLWARLSSLPKSRWSGELADLARSLPRYLRAERRDRGEEAHKRAADAAEKSHCWHEGSSTRESGVGSR